MKTFITTLVLLFILPGCDHKPDILKSPNDFYNEGVHRGLDSAYGLKISTDTSVTVSIDWEYFPDDTTLRYKSKDGTFVLVRITKHKIRIK